MSTVNMALSIQVAGGPQIAISRTKTIEAYDKIEVVVEPGAKDKPVQIQPSPANQISLIVITSNLYGTEIQFTASNGTKNSDSIIILDEPLILMGSGATGLLGIDPPQILKFTNDHKAEDANKKATIEILVGRDATP